MSEHKEQPREGRPVALVTGGAQGIGRGVAEELLARGYDVHVAYHSEAKRPSVVAQVGETHAHVAELTDPASASQVIARVQAVSRRLDAVVHAVGPYTTSPLAETSTATFQAMLDGNLFTALNVIEASRQLLRESQGAYLFFGCAGLERWRARTVTTAYISAKAALLVAMRGLALEEAPHGVRANMISPGFIPHEGAAPDTLQKDLHAKIPQGRPGEMSEVAETAAFLLSPGAGHIVGQNVEVAGGWML